jgi:hypothetical protein
MKYASIVFLGIILFVFFQVVATGQNAIAFVDSFSQGNTHDWLWKTGSWTFADSIVSTGTQDGHHFLIQPHYIFSNLIFQTDVMKLDDADHEHPAIVFRWVNDTMNYVFRINGYGSQSWIQLMRDMDNRDQNGQYIATVPWFTDENDHRMNKGVWYTMKVQADTSSIKCKVWRTSDTGPGTWNLEVIDSLYTQGEIGLEYYSGAHKFDNVVVSGEYTIVSGAPAEDHFNPALYSIEQNYPNPFNPATTINYQLPVESKVVLRIYNVLGQVKAILANGVQPAGLKSVTWNAANVSSGIYFYKLDGVSMSDPGKSFTQMKKMILLK